MDSGSQWLLVLFVLMVVGGAYFAGAESAFSAVNKIRIKALADEGDPRKSRRAKKVLFILSHFDEALTALLIGNNITHIAAASIATVIATRLWGNSDTIAEGTLNVICTFVSTGIVFLFSEMIPKSFANDRSDTMALVCAGSLRILMKILKPLVAFFSLISRTASKLFHGEETPSITEEELIDIIDTAEEEGVVDEEQSDLLKSALEFSDTTVEDVMTVRSDIFAINLALPNDEIMKRIQEYGFSRVPVYQGRLDNLVGILNTRQFMAEYAKNKDVDVKRIAARPYPTRGTAKINDLLTFMRQHRLHMAVVTNDNRHIIGLVTIEDILEELVGEIWDEEDEHDDSFLKMGGNHFLVVAKMTIGEALDRIGCPCSNKSFRQKPLLAWMYEVFKRIPEEDEFFRFGPLTVTIDSIENKQISKLLIFVDTNGKDTMPSVTGTEEPLFTTEEDDEQSSKNNEEAKA